MATAHVEISMAQDVEPILQRVGDIEVRVEALEEARLSDRLAYRVNAIEPLVGVSESQIRQYIKTGKLRAHKAGKQLLVLRCDLLDWLGSLPVADVSAYVGRGKGGEGRKDSG